MNLPRALLVLTLLTLTPPTPAHAQSAPATKPNVIFILADDLGPGDIGPFGQKLIATPHLDRMAAEGMKFTRSYAPTSVCAPTRCSLMTGLHQGHAYIRANKELPTEGQTPMPAETFTVAHLFKSAGYATGAFGKWGLGHPGSASVPEKMGFDLFFGYNCQRQAHEYYPKHLWRNDQKVELDGKTYSADLIHKESLAWIRARAGEKTPFFAYLAYTLPHGKFQVPDQGPYADKPWTPACRSYAAMITRMDAHIGEVFALLKESGIDENTLVIFGSDNGAANQQFLNTFNSSGGLRGMKRSMYEGGLRSPTLARWPARIKPGSTNDTPWTFTDFLPTAAELSGATIPSNRVKPDGVSIAPLFDGGSLPPRPLYFELHEGKYNQAVRDGDWKLCRHGATAPLELYDLKADPAETTGVAAAHPDVVQRLSAWMASQHTPSDLWPDRDARPQQQPGRARTPQN